MCSDVAEASVGSTRSSFVSASRRALNVHGPLKAADKFVAQIGEGRSLQQLTTRPKAFSCSRLPREDR